MNRDFVRDRLIDELAFLEVDELRTLLYLAKRLTMGQRQYGPLSLAEDKRDWRKERRDELADAVIYTAFEALKEQE